MSLNDQVILITGGSKGIGKAIAEQAAAQGAKVVINYSSDNTAANDFVEKIGPEEALAVQADVSSVTEIEKLVKKAVDRFDKIDVLIPNAAAAPMNDLESTTEQAFDQSFNMNVKGPYFLVQPSRICRETGE
ncbi:hypothetical protein FSOLCH5_013718 [Fusarium solani]|nr:hypothetical protein NW759_016112 [Fusarium solani]